MSSSGPARVPAPGSGPEERLRRPLAARVGLAAVALLLIGIGLVGWLVPIVPGWPALVPGVLLLAASSRRMARVLDAARRRLPAAWRTRLRRPSDGP